MLKTVLLVALLAGTATLCWSQDKIYRKNGKIVEAKVLEIGSAEVKYKEFSNPDGPIYVLETDRIIKIVYENGKVEKFADDLSDPERYQDQLKKAIKVDFFGPLLGYSQISFEKSVRAGRSYELSLGVIGAGKSSRLDYYNNDFHDVRRKQFGFFASAGYKFGKLPDFVFFGHSKHVTKAECSTCHGAVMQQDAVKLQQPLKMKWCVDCHKQNKATLVCVTCHELGQ